MQLRRFNPWAKVLAALCLVGAPAIADVLPDDRADVLYHNYDGGGITIQGPSVLVRKKVGDSLSFSASYYEDLISSASIDVKLSASPYHETRKQEGFSVDYLHGKTIYTAGYIHSREPDYYVEHRLLLHQPEHVRRSHDRDLRLSPRLGRRVPRHQGRTASFRTTRRFTRQADHRGYSLSVSQILTRNAILDLNFEAHHGRGLSAEPLPQDPLLRSDRTGQAIHARGPDLSRIRAPAPPPPRI